MDINLAYSRFFCLKWALQRGFQVTSEGKNQILKKISTNIFFGVKRQTMEENNFIFTAKFIQ